MQTILLFSVTLLSIVVDLAMGNRIWVTSSSTWWRHQMETFSALLALCVGNSPVAGEFPAQRPVTRSFDIFFHLRLNKRLSKQLWDWWSETPSCPLWRHSNDLPTATCNITCSYFLGYIDWCRFFTNPLTVFTRKICGTFWFNFNEVGSWGVQFPKKLELIQIMAWCLAVTSRWPNQWWPSSLTFVCVTRPRWHDWADVVSLYLILQ